MEQKSIAMKGLLLIGTDVVMIPGLAIVGAASILAAAGYGVYKFITKKVSNKKD